MPIYYLGKNKEVIVHSQTDARRIGYRMMKSSKYVYDYVQIFNSDGKLYGEVSKSGEWIGLKTYSGSKINLYPLKENGEFKKPDLARPYFYTYGNKTYRFKTLKDARRSALHLNPKSVRATYYDLDIFKETKSGFYLYQKLEIRDKGQIFCYLKEKFGYGLYKVMNNGEVKKWK